MRCPNLFLLEDAKQAGLIRVVVYQPRRSIEQGNGFGFLDLSFFVQAIYASACLYRGRELKVAFQLNEPLCAFS